MFLRASYNYDADAVSAAIGLDCSVDAETGEELKSMAQQQFKEECDINEIVRRFGLTGQLPENYSAPQSGDFTGITDFQTAMNAVVDAQERFMALPASIRAEFGNDPQKLIAFVDDEKNRDKAIEIGLIQKPAEKTRDVVQAVDELAARLTPTEK